MKKSVNNEKAGWLAKYTFCPSLYCNFTNLRREYFMKQSERDDEK